MLIDELCPQRNLSYPPLFQVVFSMQNAPVSELLLPGLRLRVPDFGETAAKYDLLMDVWEENEGVAGVLEYNADLFEASTARHLVAHYQTLLRQIASDPGQRISDLAILNEQERNQVIEDWNTSAHEYPRSRCIHELIEDAVTEAPDAIALICGAQHITYRELSCRSNSLSHYLRKLHVGPGMLVAICMEHSIDEVIALLGVLKTGAAYVPLDPDQPPHRLQKILQDAEPGLVLTQSPVAARFPEGGVPRLCLDETWSAILDCPSHSARSGCTPNDLAYVIYTSGSTGEPKGVAISHRSLLNYIWWADRTYVRGENLAFALYSSLAFDLTITSLFTPLIRGNSLYIYPQQMDGFSLGAVFQDDAVGVVKLTPSHMLLVSAWDKPPVQLRRMIVGGEAFPRLLADKFRSSFHGDLEIYNEYGPTEATVGCMIYKYDPADIRDFVPAGRAAANGKVYILDNFLNPVPETVIGELYIGGDGLAHGYYGKSGLTAEKFIPSPFGEAERIYRTGDLARWLPGGTLEYMGRSDEQVKLNGHRVELGEIEAVLRQHPAVREAAAVLRTDTGSRILLAYVALNGEALENHEELRFFVQHRIPAYMMPAKFIELEELPKTRNGKIDRRALSERKVDLLAKEREYVAPQTDTERLIAAIWARNESASTMISSCWVAIPFSPSRLFTGSISNSISTCRCG